MGGPSSSCCSSGEEDGDADWKAAISSVASTTVTNSFSATVATTTTNSNGPTNNTVQPHSISNDEDHLDNKTKPQNLKHYQIKVMAQKLLEDILEKSLVIVRDPDPVDPLDNNPAASDGGIRLFKRAPPGIAPPELGGHILLMELQSEDDVLFLADEVQGPRKRPRILPGDEINEKSKKFQRKLQSVAIDGSDVISAARVACQKSLVRLEAKEAAAKAAAKREEERVAELKKLRGERWLPSIAKEMQGKILQISNGPSRKKT
ncbi:hypothetical protein RJ641_010156 [Dillenia turbinata]|uniref:Uncharacterized protein n=1 Tax=Dillenia turbinata TaxID=194707 RepID=A0AAN8Z400_9MAGN